MPAYPHDSSSQIAASLGSLAGATPVSVVAKRLLEIFTNGSIEPGTRLPPERQLAASLTVGRSAVREALAALEILGIVDVRPGSGTYLRGNASELLPQTLSWGLMIGEPKTLELIELRSGLEIYAARLAATRATDDQIAGLGRRVDEMRARVSDLKKFVEADLQFHLELAKSINNVVLLDLLQSIRSLLRVWADRAVQDTQHVETAILEHAAVYAALSSRDPDAAASAMALHMNTAGRRLSGSLEL